MTSRHIAEVMVRAAAVRPDPGASHADATITVLDGWTAWFPGWAASPFVGPATVRYRLHDSGAIGFASVPPAGTGWRPTPTGRSGSVADPQQIGAASGGYLLQAGPVASVGATG